METKELQIGDLIKLKGYDYYYKVESIFYNAIRIDFNHEIMDIDIDRFEPIPLTEEILVSNGFKNVGKYEWQDEMYVTRYRYIDNEAYEIFEINYTPDYDGFNVKGFDVNEVHKLQHLLRLANLNELADNFKLN